MSREGFLKIIFWLARVSVFLLLILGFAWDPGRTANVSGCTVHTGLNRVQEQDLLTHANILGMWNANTHAHTHTHTHTRTLKVNSIKLEPSHNQSKNNGIFTTQAHNVFSLSRIFHRVPVSIDRADVQLRSKLPTPSLCKTRHWTSAVDTAREDHWPVTPRRHFKRSQPPDRNNQWRRKDGPEMYKLETSMRMTGRLCLLVSDTGVSGPSAEEHVADKSEETKSKRCYWIRIWSNVLPVYTGARLIKVWSSWCVVLLRFSNCTGLVSLSGCIIYLYILIKREREIERTNDFVFLIFLFYFIFY